MSEPVFQSALGTVSGNSGRTQKTWNDGSLNVGQVTKMHHKRSTADSAVLNGPNVIMSREELEGQNAPIICSRYAGYDEFYKKPYGEFIPMQKGDRPVIVYAQNDKAKPMIVGVLHHTDDKVGEVNEHDILPVEYPIDPDDRREALRQIWIHHCQDGLTIDGANGEFELSSHTKSFVRSCREYEDEETFDYEDLTLKDKKSVAEEDPKTIHLPARYSHPLKYFAVFRNHYEDAQTDYLRLCVDASTVSGKIMQQKPNENKLSYAELKEDGSIKIRCQGDSVKRESGSQHAEITLREDGVQISVNGGDAVGDFSGDQILLRVGSSSIRITEGGISMNSPTPHP